MLIVQGGSILTMTRPQRVISGGSILIQDDSIQAVLEAGVSLPEGDHTVIDAGGDLVVPGLVNTHVTVAAAASRANFLMTRPQEDTAPDWRLSAVPEDREGLLYAALAGFLEQIRLGVTTVFDFLPAGNRSSIGLSTLSDAASLIGMRACLSLGVSDHPPAGKALGQLREVESFARWCLREDSPYLRPMLGLFRPSACTDETLQAVADAGTRLGVGLHMTIAATAGSAQECFAKHNIRIVQRLHDFGLLGPETIAAYCIHVVDQEIDILRNSETFVAHVPSADLWLGRSAPISSLLKNRLRVGIGTSNPATSPLSEARLSHLLHFPRMVDGIPAGGEEPFLDMLIPANNRLAGAVFGFRMGEISPGAVADIATFHTPLPSPITPENWRAHLLFGAIGSTPARHVLVGGNHVIREGKMQTIEEQEILAKARELGYQAARP